jgi:uracil-DNA glycosylase
MEDRPRMFRDPAAIAERELLNDEPHVAPLNKWVRDLRRRLGGEAIIPWFDPWDGGVDAEILWLLEAPGAKATRELGGSGFISPNNNDGTAQNTWETREEAGVPRPLVVHWNAIPYYLGSETEILASTPGDIAEAGPLLRELLDLMPKLRAVIVGGKVALKTWHRFASDEHGLAVIPCPHPSPRNFNTRPWARDEVIAAWRTAMNPAQAQSTASTGTERHASDSSEQQQAEELIVAAAAQHYGAPLKPAQVNLRGGSFVKVDGVNLETLRPIFVEAFARQGILKGGQLHKLQGDVLKLALLAKHHPGAQLAIAVADQRVAQRLASGWLGEAIRGFSIEVIVADLPDDLRKTIRDAQLRQTMVNPELS